MTGITSYGGYIPRLRLNRMSIVQHMGWFAPAIVTVAQGERSFCNWDEDSLTMAVEASRDCLVGCDKSQVDGVILCSTTPPFQDRLNAGILKTALNLGDSIQAADCTSSLRAGATGLLQALADVESGRNRRVLVAASDRRMTRTAYFYEMWFGDGAASVLVGNRNVIAQFLGSHSVTHDFVDHYRGSGTHFDYMWEERWARDEGYSKIIPQAISGLMDKLSLSMKDVNRLVFPCLFKAEHRKIAARLGAAPEQVMDNLHEQCGETGAAHPLVMFVHALQESRPGDRILMAGFGQGCDALCFEVTEAIQDLPERRGILGSLADKRETDNYLKFLKFRDLIQTEMGIRAEVPMQTAMSVLWRKRDMILGLVGGRCNRCGTPQFPRTDICVNPDCRGLRTQEPYEFADVPARINSYTGDLLAVSVDPPSIYGMIQFEGGGRFMADFTDCDMSQVRVGQRVRMSFRKRYTDTNRGFTGYFWKAAPRKEEPVGPESAESIRFDGQVAVVTGAGSGLGRQYALELARRGARVVVNDLGSARDGKGEASSTSADAVVQEIRESGGEAVSNYDSVTTPEGGRAIIQTALDTFGGVTILINNAGILRDKTLGKMEPEDWNAVLDVHLHGAFNVTRPAVEVMKKKKYGRILFTSSASGLYGTFGQTNYSAAKTALLGFMNSLRLETEKYDIKVNSIAPVAATRMTEDVFPPDLFEKLKPEFVTPLVMVLCSNRCRENGMVFNAVMGYFNRAAVLTGAGAVIGDRVRIPTPEEIHAQWERINDLSDSREFPNATAALGVMMDSSTEPPREPHAETTSGEAVRRIFDRIPDAFQEERAGGVDVVFQFSISGSEGGEWNVAVKDNRCRVAEGTHPKPTTTIKMADEDFIRMIQGALNPMTAFTAGKLKIQGDIMKSQLIEKLFTF